MWYAHFWAFFSIFRFPLLTEGKVKRDGEARTASFMSSFINLANTILGAGMLGLPFALSKNGVGLGSIFIFLRYRLFSSFDKCGG